MKTKEPQGLLLACNKYVFLKWEISVQKQVLFIMLSYGEKIIAQRAENMFHVVNFPFIHIMLVALSGTKWK